MALDYKEAIELYYNAGACKSAKCKGMDLTRGAAGTAQLTLACAKCKWSVLITPQIEGDVHVIMAELVHERIRALYALIENSRNSNKNGFKAAQAEFAALSAQITALADSQEARARERTALLQTLMDQVTELATIFYERKRAYESLRPAEITSQQLRELNAIAINEGKIADKRVAQVAKQVGAPADVVTGWMEWLLLVRRYSQVKKRVNESSVLIENFDKQTDVANHTAIYRAGTVEKG